MCVCIYGHTYTIQFGNTFFGVESSFNSRPDIVVIEFDRHTLLIVKIENRGKGRGRAGGRTFARNSVDLHLKDRVTVRAQGSFLVLPVRSSRCPVTFFCL